MRLYAKAGVTPGWRWFHVFDLDRNREMKNVIECDVIRGRCLVADDFGEHDERGNYYIYDERH